MPLINDDLPVEDGQFDDAPEEAPAAPAQPATDPRAGHHYIDDEQRTPSDLEDDEDDDELDEFDLEEDALEDAAFDSLRAEDEDWEIAERDFTKQYNRIRQHVAVRTGAAQGMSSTINGAAAVASLPAINRPRQAQKSNATSSGTQSKDKTENQLQALAKFNSRLRNLDTRYDLAVGVNRKGPSATANMKDKSDRATTEQVLDPRTRIILYKMIGRGLLYEVNGCVSTGKEANVYHAVTPENRHLALKIYKTSILVFKDRDRYVSGEHRFRRGYSRHNPRKMVRVWAEKEMRNLKRLQSAGIPCPDPIEVRENVLVMGFIGDADGWASPRLKDASIPATEFSRLYEELVLMTRKLFHDCKLVHADLSEYNILYHVDAVPDPTQGEQQAAPVGEPPQAPHITDEPQGHLYIIDVSQSVEHDHPHAFDFLRSDLRNVEDFFAKRGAHTLGLRGTFEFVIKDNFDAEGGDAAALRAWIARRKEAHEENYEAREGEGDGAAAGDARTAKAEHEDEVFMKSFIPRTLNEVYDPERDVGALNRGEGEKLIYKDAIGIVTKNHDKQAADAADAAAAAEVHGESDAEAEDSDSDSAEGSEDEDEDDTDMQRAPRGHRHEDKDAKKERKKAVKAEAKEKRKHKIPKAEKKRKVRSTARGK